MNLFEVFNTSVDFHWTAWEEDYREAKFTAGGIDYTVTFQIDGEDEDDPDAQTEWQFKTEVNGRQTTRMTGQGNALLAFGAVVQIVDAYQQKAKPAEMMYTLSDNSPSRLKFYNRLGKHFQKIGYRVKTKTEDGVKFWIMSK